MGELLRVRTADLMVGNALHAAAVGGRESVVQLLLEKGADVNAQGGQYGNALHAAVVGGHKGIVKLLIEKGADVNARGPYGTPLQAASFRGHEELVRLLLEKGADPNLPGSSELFNVCFEGLLNVRGDHDNTPPSPGTQTPKARICGRDGISSTTSYSIPLGKISFNFLEDAPNEEKARMNSGIINIIKEKRVLGEKWVCVPAAKPDMSPVYQESEVQV
jgi:ankyrin repeat protein